MRVCGPKYIFLRTKKIICCAFVHTGEMFVYMEKEDFKFVSVRVPKELAELAKARAKSQHRNLQGHMRHLLEQDIMQSGIQESAQSVDLPQDKQKGKYQNARQARLNVGAKMETLSENLDSGPSTATKKNSLRTG
jgi:hypothetical protein